jgi:hypothetical protein
MKMAKNAAYLVVCARNWARSKNITFNGGVVAGYWNMYAGFFEEGALQEALHMIK